MCESPQLSFWEKPLDALGALLLEELRNKRGSQHSPETLLGVVPNPPESTQEDFLWEKSQLGLAFSSIPLTEKANLTCWLGIGA